MYLIIIAGMSVDVPYPILTQGSVVKIVVHIYTGELDMTDHCTADFCI